MRDMEEFVKSRDNDGRHQENKGNWNRPVKGLVLEESHFKDGLVNRFNVKGMEQLDQTESCKSHGKGIRMDLSMTLVLWEENGPTVNTKYQDSLEDPLIEDSSEDSAIKEVRFTSTRFVGHDTWFSWFHPKSDSW